MKKILAGILAFAALAFVTVGFAMPATTVKIHFVTEEQAGAFAAWVNSSETFGQIGIGLDGHEVEVGFPTTGAADSFVSQLQNGAFVTFSQDTGYGSAAQASFVDPANGITLTGVD